MLRSASAFDSPSPSRVSRAHRLLSHGQRSASARDATNGHSASTPLANRKAGKANGDDSAPIVQVRKETAFT